VPVARTEPARKNDRGHLVFIRTSASDAADEAFLRGLLPAVDGRA
jgi:hypothetical protein